MILFDLNLMDITFDDDDEDMKNKSDDDSPIIKRKVNKSPLIKKFGNLGKKFEMNVIVEKKVEKDIVEKKVEKKVDKKVEKEKKVEIKSKLFESKKDTKTVKEEKKKEKKETKRKTIESEEPPTKKNKFTLKNINTIEIDKKYVSKDLLFNSSNLFDDEEDTKTITSKIEKLQLSTLKVHPHDKIKIKGNND